jgi:hypothetical protein
MINQESLASSLRLLHESMFFRDQGRIQVLCKKCCESLNTNVYVKSNGRTWWSITLQSVRSEIFLSRMIHKKFLTTDVDNKCANWNFYANIWLDKVNLSFIKHRVYHFITERVCITAISIVLRVFILATFFCFDTRQTVLALLQQLANYDDSVA